MTELPGGLRTTYELPVDEVRFVAVLCRRGLKTLRQDGVVLDPRVIDRVHDLELAAEVVRRQDIADGNPPTRKTSGSGIALEGTGGKVLSVNEVALLSGLGVRRVRGLAGIKFAARRTSAGWQIDSESVERWLANRADRSAS